MVSAGAGAAMGTLICPGIGTAIGAGAGAVAGKLSSKKQKSKTDAKYLNFRPWASRKVDIQKSV